MNNIYDFIVIGAGISGCTFVSCLNKRFPNASILLVEHGRRIGGRSTTRKSRKNINLEFDHGLPSITFSQNISKEINAIISPLIKSKKLIDISKEILMINEYGEMNYIFTNNKIYRSLPFMINFSQEIIDQSINPKKINFLFETLAKSIRRINNLWEIKTSGERSIKSKNLILSSSLLAHPRCLDILNIESLPLIHAFEKSKDSIVDSVIRQTRKQHFIKRKIYILYVSSSESVKRFIHKYLQIYFSRLIREDLNYEKIIFQRQYDGSMIIILHCYFIDQIHAIEIDEIIKSLLKIFAHHKKFVDLFSQTIQIDSMEWRASQPINNLLPRELQWSSSSNIGFCGDWIDSNGFSGVEKAMNSSIRLAMLLQSN